MIYNKTSISENVLLHDKTVEIFIASICITENVKYEFFNLTNTQQSLTFSAKYIFTYESIF